MTEAPATLAQVLETQAAELGAIVAIVLYMGGVPMLAFALGMYLPIGINMVVLLGALTAFIVARTGGSQRVRITETDTYTYWWILPPISFFVHPVNTVVEGDVEVDALPEAAEGAERTKSSPRA